MGFWEPRACQMNFMAAALVQSALGSKPWPIMPFSAAQRRAAAYHSVPFSSTGAWAVETGSPAARCRKVRIMALEQLLLASNLPPPTPSVIWGSWFTAQLTAFSAQWPGRMSRKPVPSSRPKPNSPLASW